MHRVLVRQLRRLGIAEDAPPDAEQWKRLLERIDSAYTESDHERYTNERALDLSSAEMRQRFTELRAAQGQLVDASRKAGMADVAASVLHNVGNVLNSVNVSANVVADALRSSAHGGLTKSLALLSAQPAPGRFLDEDPRGKKLLTYLGAVDRALTESQANALHELASLTQNIEHIKRVIGEQLAAARDAAHHGDIVERVTVDELVEDATKVARATFPTSRDIVVDRDGPPICLYTDRHKVKQILVNLIKNAGDAIDAQPGAGRIVVRTIKTDAMHVALEVADDGVGIATDTLARIFQHGFTTKPDGHGFGLHSCACAALELGGTLEAKSDGEGRGATFRLTLPDPRGAESVAPEPKNRTRAA